MSKRFLVPLWCSALLILGACVPSVPQVSGATPTPTPSSGGSPTPLPGVGIRPSPVPSPVPSGVPSPTPTVPSGGVVVPSELVAIRFADSNDRFLERIHETTQLKLVFLDKLGQTLPLEGLPLDWSSNRSQDFSVDGSGLVKALVDSGFAVITVKVMGTPLQAQTVINVNSPFGGGGGGGSSAPAKPVITALTKSHPDPLFLNDWIRLSVSATDNGSPLSYTWRCLESNCNNFSPAMAPQVYWQAPAAGTYTLEVTVSNGTSESTEQMIVTVTNGSGSIIVNPVLPP
jgi:hypothetical protein